MLSEPVIAVGADALVEAQLPQILVRVLGLHQGVRVRVQKVIGAGQQKAQRRAARQKRQRVEFRRGQGPLALIGLKHDPRLGDVEGAVRLEAPSIAVSYTHLRAHETVLDLVCRLLLEKKKKK